MKVFMISLVLIGILTTAVVIVIAVIETRNMDKRKDK